MENEKQELQNTEGFFVGKELAGSGTSAKGEWQRYKLKFKPSMDSQKGFSFTAFSPLKAKNTIQLEALKEGQQYRVCYAERDFIGNDGQGYTGKTAIGIYSPKKEYSKQGETDTNKLAQGTAKMDLSQFDSFKERYSLALKKDGLQPNPVHMVGSYIATFEKERVKELIEKCKEALKTG